MEKKCKICGEDCHEAECYFPMEIQCSNEVIVPDAYSKIPKHFFELHFNGLEDLQILDVHNEKFIEKNTMDWFNPAIGGIFAIKKYPLGWTVT